MQWDTYNISAKRDFSKASRDVGHIMAHLPLLDEVFAASNWRSWGAARGSK
jgi:hypothetical protein